MLINAGGSVANPRKSCDLKHSIKHVLYTYAKVELFAPGYGLYNADRGKGLNRQCIHKKVANPKFFKEVQNFFFLICYIKKQV